MTPDERKIYAQMSKALIEIVDIHRKAGVKPSLVVHTLVSVATSLMVTHSVRGSALTEAQFMDDVRTVTESAAKATWKVSEMLNRITDMFFGKR
jgi:hypothetical protein